MREYNNENYLKKILRQLYKINQLEETEKTALSKLSTIQYTGFTKSVFKLLDISDQCAKTLCNTYWLAQSDRIIYSMDKAHCDIVSKVLSEDINLKNSVNAISKTLSEYGDEISNEFKWISSYIEDILKKIQGYVVHIMKEEYFYTFAYTVALNYKEIQDYKKCLEWIKLCDSKDVVLSYEKSCLEFQAKFKSPNGFFSYQDIEETYFEALEKAKLTNYFEYYKKFLMQEYCNFLLTREKYYHAILLCIKYFETYSMDLSDENSCVMFYRYLVVANLLDDNESLQRLVNEETIQVLHQNEKVSISVPWIIWEISEIYLKWGYGELSEKYKRHMIVLINEQRGYFHNNIKQFLKISEEEFAEYMHSCDELRDSLNHALTRNDVDALYIEGRYQEKNGNYDAAFALYEAVAEQDSLRGICSLALLYYRGQGESCNYKKARNYWEYCCERGHRGSYYWLAVLLLDEDYKKKDKRSAIEYLTKAAELGSDRAKQKLQELYIEFTDK